MNPFYLARTEFTPEIKFDSDLGIYIISGVSVPEDSRLIYFPALQWLELLKNSKPTTVNMKFSFDYLNSLSLKYVYDIIKKIESFTEKNHKVEIIWDYMKDDDEMKENGAEFSRLVGVSFKVIERV